MSKRDINTPSLESLSFILRNKELWPDGFEWNFRDCHKCAMGLAHQIWREVRVPTCGDMSNVFKLGPGVAMALFTSGWDDQQEYNSYSVTPDKIADRIDAYLVAATGGEQ